MWYQDASYDHAHTVIGPGNATIATGSDPAAHGIIGDDWIDRRTGRSTNCVADTASPLVGVESTTGNASPAQLISTTFSDEWVLATAGRARAFGVSGKDRGAILPVGRTGKAFWYHGSSGRMVSSRYYYSELPPWVREFNRPVAGRSTPGRVGSVASATMIGCPRQSMTGPSRVERAASGERFRIAWPAGTWAEGLGRGQGRGSPEEEPRPVGGRLPRPPPAG